ncbi:MAG: plasmid pRiA4b ORF-3 family protein [Desulfobacterota bacterium]|nr:plasmid pRiA4b ORF-3 family protein [Thermodesulfobacteriota bacterium]
MRRDYENRPPIWRRFLVPGGITLKRLHDSLQMVMGWYGGHLHQFLWGGELFGPADREIGINRISETKTKVDQLLRRPKDRLLYEYDFGDSWEHDVVLEAILPPGQGGLYPIVEAGKRACPPEDVGGIPGYEDFLEILANPKHPEYEEMLEWAGGSFDPGHFDPREANLAIHGGWVRVKEV